MVDEPSSSARPAEVAIAQPGALTIFAGCALPSRDDAVDRRAIGGTAVGVVAAELPFAEGRSVRAVSG